MALTEVSALILSGSHHQSKVNYESSVELDGILLTRWYDSCSYKGIFALFMFVREKQILADLARTVGIHMIQKENIG